MRDKRILWGGLLLLFIFILKGVRSPEKRILGYLKDKYKEEFVIEFMGKRNGELRAEVLPKKYIGTIRQYDNYYSSTVFVSLNGDIGDNYGRVLLRESANEYFRPKLEELFGKNVLPVLTLEGGYDFPDFKKEMEKRQKKFKERPDGIFSPLSGGIYIFGRVENEADREHYRKQIYEFIQYLKAENMFDYVSLEILITEDRFLGKAFNESKDKDIIENTKTAYKRYAYIGKVLSQYNKDFEETPQSYKDKILNSKIKTNMFEQIAKKGIILLGIQIYSPKYIISRGWNKTDRKELYEEVKEYDKVDEVKFFSESYEYKFKQGEDR